MASGIREKRSFVGSKNSTSKELSAATGFSLLPLEMVEKIVRYLEDADLIAMAQVDSACRRVALREKAVRVLDGLPKELRQFCDLRVSDPLYMRPYSLHLFRRHLKDANPHSPDNYELRQSLVDLTTQDLAGRCKGLEGAFKARINGEFLSLKDLDRAADKLAQNLVIESVISRIKTSARASVIRGSAAELAAMTGSFEMIQALLANGAISEIDRGWAVLYAATSGYLEIVKTLLANGIISEESRGWAAIYSADRGFLEILQALLANGAISEHDRGWAVRHASAKGHLSLVQALLANGVISEDDRGRAHIHAQANGLYAIARLLNP
jgi:hypothetical protein